MRMTTIKIETGDPAWFLSLIEEGKNLRAPFKMFGRDWLFVSYESVPNHPDGAGFRGVVQFGRIEEVVTAA